jgi:hypothetical protein
MISEQNKEGARKSLKEYKKKEEGEEENLR